LVDPVIGNGSIVTLLPTSAIALWGAGFQPSHGLIVGA